MEELIKKGIALRFSKKEGHFFFLSTHMRGRLWRSRKLAEQWGRTAQRSYRLKLAPCARGGKARRNAPVISITPKGLAKHPLSIRPFEPQLLVLTNIELGYFWRVHLGKQAGVMVHPITSSSIHQLRGSLESVKGI